MGGETLAICRASRGGWLAGLFHQWPRQPVWQAADVHWHWPERLTSINSGLAHLRG
jgi:hypothetical protein